MVRAAAGTGVLFPQEFEDDPKEGFAYCDGESADLAHLQMSIYDDQGIRDSLLEKVDVPNVPFWPNSIAAFTDISAESSEDLLAVLEYFPKILEGMPCGSMILAAVLFQAEKEKDKIAVFERNGWKMLEENDGCVVGILPGRDAIEMDDIRSFLEQKMVS